MTATLFRCPKCGDIDPDHFRPGAATATGTAAYCRPCWAAYIRGRRVSSEVQREADRRQRRAYQGALKRLRELHRDEFDRLLESEYARLGGRADSSKGGEWKATPSAAVCGAAGLDASRSAAARESSDGSRPSTSKKRDAGLPPDARRAS